MTRAAPLIAAAILLAASLAFRLEPARVTISGDDALPPVRVERNYPAALRSMSSLADGAGSVAPVTMTSPYLKTIAVPCSPPTSVGGICHMAVPVSQ